MPKKAKTNEVVEEIIIKATQEDIEENNLEGIVEPGDEIIIPNEEPILISERECTCGEIVKLPDGSAEEFTVCKGCGIRHIR